MLSDRKTDAVLHFLFEGELLVAVWKAAVRVLTGHRPPAANLLILRGNFEVGLAPCPSAVLHCIACRLGK